MPLYHVSITGRDRRHLSALGPKLRVVVVGYREDRRGIVVDAYVPVEKIPWLSRQGYTVTRLEEVDGHARQRQSGGPHGCRQSSEAGTLRRCHLGRWLSHCRRGRGLHRARREKPLRLFRAHPATELDLGKAAMPCRPHRQGWRQTQVRRLLHWRRAWAGVGQPRHPCLFRDAATPGLSRPEGRSSWWEEFHCSADSGNRRGDGRRPLPPGKSRRPTFQHGSSSDVEEEPPARAAGPRPQEHRRRPQPEFSVPLAFRSSLRSRHGGKLLQPRGLRNLRWKARSLRARNPQCDLATRPLSEHPVFRRSAQLRRDDPAQLGQ